MKILFQGDSITDAGRNREDYHNLGYGYPFYAAENIKKDFPDTEFEFIDLGISGNQTKDLLVRLESDFIDIQPDIISILIGINDVWHHAEDRSWIPDEVFESNYRKILTAIKEKTNAKIMIIEPFLIPVNTEKDFFYEDLAPKTLIIRKLAREFADVYLPLEGMLAAEFVKTEPIAFSPDGVHPSTEGARFIGEKYAQAIKPLIEQFK